MTTAAIENKSSTGNEKQQLKMLLNQISESKAKEPAKIRPEEIPPTESKTNADIDMNNCKREIPEKSEQPDENGNKNEETDELNQTVVIRHNIVLHKSEERKRYDSVDHTNKTKIQNFISKHRIQVEQKDVQNDTLENIMISSRPCDQKASPSLSPEKYDIKFSEESKIFRIGPQKSNKGVIKAKANHDSRGRVISEAVNFKMHRSK